MLYVLLQAHLLHSVSYKTILLFLNLCKNNKNLPAFNSWQKERRELVHHVYVSLQLKSQFRNTGRKILAFLYWHQRKRFVFRILIIELNSFMNLFHCSPHDFYWMHLFHISRNTSCTLPPRPLSRKNSITLLGITVVPREIQGKAKLMQNCGEGGGGWTRCIMGNVKIVNSKLLGGAMPLDVTWDQPNVYKTERNPCIKNAPCWTCPRAFHTIQEWRDLYFVGYNLRALLAGVEVWVLISRHVSPRKARLLARFAETKLLNDKWTPVKDGVLRDEIHGRFRNKRLYNIFLL